MYPVLADLAVAFDKFKPIGILLIVVAIVISRLPRVDLGNVIHSDAFRKRRLLNWLPLGLTYSFLYMGRYNIKVSHHAFEKMMGPDGDLLMSNQAFAEIFFWGVLTYGCSFLVNGPLTDKLGGKFAILIGAGGALIANALMGVCTMWLVNDPTSEASRFVGSHFVLIFSLLYAVNMYFQSFGAVAIVKCNASWFHVRERGVFGAIFGILISLGVYFAFDWGYMIMEAFPLQWVFFAPALILAVFWVFDLLIVRNTPGEADHDDFDTADASSGDDGPALSAIAVFKKMLTNPVILTIAFIEFCSGFLRQAIMQWFRTFASQTDDALGLKDSFVYENWGMLLCCAGIMGGVFAGTISDHLFQSRRGPVAAVLYALMLACGVILAFVYDSPAVAPLVIIMSMAIIGVHGMLSGTASMDFGGRRNVGIAVGIIDGFVYAGTACMSILYAFILPSSEVDSQGVKASADPANWIAWPLSMIPVAVIGLFLAARIWNAKPKGK